MKILVLVLSIVFALAMDLHIDSASSTDLDSTKYTPEQFLEFKAKFPSISDQTLARFLIARNGDVEKASTLLNSHLEWKNASWPYLKESLMPDIGTGKIYVRGVDKAGHPIGMSSSTPCES